mmetsp:Transcript_9901/g.30267  ORF Transcript_9901/g.30267 Transcript_9901/m.30267 type:complete len:577 (-) Transcript_9901:1864-3594(-)
MLGRWTALVVLAAAWICAAADDGDVRLEEISRQSVNPYISGGRISAEQESVTMFGEPYLGRRDLYFVEGKEAPRTVKTAAAVNRMHAVVRRIAPSFTTEAVTTKSYGNKQWNFTLEAAVDGTGGLGVILTCRTAPKNSAFKVGVAARFTSVPLNMRFDINLAEDTNSGEKGRWVYYFVPDGMSGEVVTMRPSGITSPIYAPRGLLTSTKKVAPMQLLGKNMFLGAYSRFWFSPPGPEPEQRYQLGLYLRGTFAEGKVYYQRSTNARDIAYVKARILRVKSPFDPLEVYASTAAAANGDMLQTIVGVDRNGFMGIIVSFSPSIKVTEAILQVSLGVGDTRQPTAFATEVPLGRSPARRSNVGLRGTHVFTMTSRGVLLGSRQKLKNFYGVCGKREQLMTDKQFGLVLPGGRMGTDSVRFDLAVGLQLVTEFLGEGPARGSVGFTVLGRGLGGWPFTYCSLDKTGLTTVERDVRKAGARTFRAKRGVMLKFAMGEEGRSYTGQVTFVESTDRRLAGVLSMSPDLELRMLLSATSAPKVELDQSVEFNSTDSNVGRPGRQVFVMRRRARGKRVFEVVPK